MDQQKIMKYTALNMNYMDMEKWLNITSMFQYFYEDIYIQILTNLINEDIATIVNSYIFCQNYRKLIGLRQLII